MDKAATQEDKLVVVEELRAPVCSNCGSRMTYVGPDGVTPKNADSSGGYFQCPHGHIEAIDPNN